MGMRGLRGEAHSYDEWRKARGKREQMHSPNLYFEDPGGGGEWTGKGMKGKKKGA